MSEKDRDLVTWALARVLEALTTTVLAQRIDSAQQVRQQTEAQREAKDVTQAVDDWLRGNGEP
jgi:hypothetical protein